MALGRGLNSLIPNRRSDAPVVSSPAPSDVVSSNEVAIEKIRVNPHQPRKYFHHSELEDLMNSIKVHGIIQPLVVTQNSDGTYELIAGERRLRSAKLLGLSRVPIIIRQAKEQEKLEVALIENIQRKSLNSLEEAQAYNRLVSEFDLTQEEVANRLGKSRSAVANTLRILDLPQEVQQAIADEKITEGHARAIAALENRADQLALLKKIIENNISVRSTEKEVKRVRGFRSKTFDPAVLEYEEKLRNALGTLVQITKRGGRGSINIPFKSAEDFQNIINQLLK